MYKEVKLPKLRFRDWLFQVRPTLSITSEDRPGTTSETRIKINNKLVCTVTTCFEPDPVVAVSDEESNNG